MLLLLPHLQVRLVLDELLSAAVQQADVGVSTLHQLTYSNSTHQASYEHLQNFSTHACREKNVSKLRRTGSSPPIHQQCCCSCKRAAA
jgi:hypothetical protein